MHYVTRTNICTCILINGMWWIHSVFFLKCSRFKSRLNVVIKSHIYVTVSVSYSAINKPSEGFQKGGGVACAKHGGSRKEKCLPSLGAPEGGRVCQAWGLQKGRGGCRVQPGSIRKEGKVVWTKPGDYRREEEVVCDKTEGSRRGKVVYGKPRSSRRRGKTVPNMGAPERGRLFVASLPVIDDAW